MYAILAEDESDTDVLTHIVRRHFDNRGLQIKRKGYDGCGGLCAKGARDIKRWSADGINRFIICHDADAFSPEEIREKVMRCVVRPTGLDLSCCITIPVQEIESWIIADEAAIKKVIPSFDFSGHANPESIRDPKEWLIKQSEAANGKPLYSPKTFNAAVAQHLRLEVVATKCRSFKSFLACLKKWHSA